VPSDFNDASVTPLVQIVRAFASRGQAISCLSEERRVPRAHLGHPVAKVLQIPQIASARRTTKSRPLRTSLRQ
jgi:hypothetical protein